MTTNLFIQAYSEARKRLTALIEIITSNDLSKKLDTCPNSIGFLLRHIADVELLFSKNVFNNHEIHVVAKTVIDGKDSGQWTNFEEIKTYLAASEIAFQETIKLQKPDSWTNFITTKEFGTKTKAEAYGRIISHTAYHTGQIALILKYGK